MNYGLVLSNSLSSLIKEEPQIPNVNEEFNQYMDYYMQLIRMKSKGNVLVVEDDFSSRLFLEHAIKSFSPQIHVLKATSEVSALQILAAVPCDLIIADYYLEGPGTGLDLCRKVQKKYPHSRCLMISGMAFYEYKNLALNSEEQPDFMEKPLSKNGIKKYLSSYFEEINF